MPRSRTQRTVTLIVAAIAVATLAAGCSSGDGSSKAKESSKATTTTVAGDPDRDTLPPIDPDTVEGGKQAYVDALEKSAEAFGDITKEQTTCVAGAWVDLIGLKGFADSGVSAEALDSGEASLGNVQIDDATAQDMVAAMHDCDIDVRATVLAQLVPVQDLPEDLRPCLDAAITDEVADTVLAKYLTGLTEQPPEFADAQKCLDDYQAAQIAEQQQQQQQGGN